MSCGPLKTLVLDTYHKLSTKWAQTIEKLGCNLFFNAQLVALTDDANLQNFGSMSFWLRVHFESPACPVDH